MGNNKRSALKLQYVNKRNILTCQINLAIISSDILNNGEENFDMTCIFDYSKIIKEICSRGLTYGEVARVLGISERKYFMKMSNLEEFTQSEIDKMAAFVLEIPPERIPEYFFTPIVQKI